MANLMENREFEPVNRGLKEKVESKILALAQVVGLA